MIDKTSSYKQDTEVCLFTDLQRTRTEIIIFWQSGPCQKI